MSNPFDLASLVTEAVDEIVRTVAERGDLTEVEIAMKARLGAALIISCRPRDVTELTLVAQTFMLSEVFAECARVALAPGRSGQREMASFIKVGRLMQGQIGLLRQSGVGSYRNGDKPEHEQAWRAVAAHAVGQVMARRRPALTPLLAVAEPEPEQTGVGMPDGVPMAETTWLDPPFEQWLINIFGNRAGRSADVVALRPRSEVEPVPALPRRPSGYPRSGK